MKRPGRLVLITARVDIDMDDQEVHDFLKVILWEQGDLGNRILIEDVATTKED